MHLKLELTNFTLNEMLKETLMNFAFIEDNFKNVLI